VVEVGDLHDYLTEKVAASVLVPHDDGFTFSRSFDASP
jgi:hypothetical protein